MKNKDPRIDAYIKNAAPFAQPILHHIRSLLHTACPNVGETMKWSFPHFDYMGSTLCSMAAFKEHCAFGFWKAALMKDPGLLENARSEKAMGHFGRILSITDLPSDKQMIAYIKEAMVLNEKGRKIERKKTEPLPVPDIPAELAKALTENKTAGANFEKLSAGHRKEYINWIDEAKTDPTRDKRISQTIEWVMEGKSRNWQYAAKK